MNIKTVATRFKTLDKGEMTSDGVPAESSGTWEAIVSVFHSKDLMGDVIKPGAFTATLADWEARGDSIPCYFAHQLQDPMMNIGWTLDAHEVEAKDGRPAGLYALSQADLDNPVAAQTFKLMQSRRLTNSSFSFNVPLGGEEYVPPADEKADPWETGDFGSFSITAVDLYEHGPCVVPAQPDVVLLGTKSGSSITVPPRLLAAASKAGRVLSSKNLASLSDARDILDQVIKDAEAQPEAGKSRRPRRESLVLSSAFGDPPADPPGDGPAPTMDDVKADVQDAADSLKSALDGLEALGSDSAPPGGKSAVVSTRSRGPVEGEAEGVHSVSVDRLRLLADSLTMS